MKKILFFLLLILCFCQIYSNDEDQMEKLFSSEDETYKVTELHNYLQNLKKNKININEAKYSDLIRLPWLSPKQVDEIIKFRKKREITNIKNLQLTGISEDTIEEILPYISFHTSEPIYFQSRIRGQYKPDMDYESCLKFLQKYQLDWKNYHLTFLSQKDEGEKDFWDYYSGSLTIFQQNIVKKIILGNYRLALGQGIIFAPKLGISKGGNATRQPMKYFSTIKPYTSTMETYSLFGVAGKIKFGNFQILPFISDYKLDANLDDGKITSLDIIGFHRTEAEIAKKDNVREKIYGSHISYGDKNQIGFTALNLEFNLPFADENIRQKQEIFGVDFQYNLQNFNFIGEGAISEKRKAILLTLFWEQGEFENLIIFRNYEKYFPTFHGNPFHTSGDFDNECGIYYGISFRPLKRTKLDMYFDIYKFPEQKSLVDMPTYGFDKFLQFEKKWKLSKMRFTFQQKQYENWRTFSDESKIYQRERNIFRLDWRQKITSSFEIKLRGEFTFHQYKNVDKYDSGILFYQDFKFMFSPKLTNYIRICQYHTDDIILYMFENDLNGIMLNSQFNGDGIFVYFLMKYDFGKNFSLQMKLAEKICKEVKLERTEQIKFQIETEF